MTTKKDFTTNVNKVHSSIAAATAAEPVINEAEPITEPRKDRKTYTMEQAADFLANGQTTGHKGVKLPRINMAFYPDVYDYVQTMSRVTGQTMTDFVNAILRNYMAENSEIYEKARAFRDSL